jgi:hypothetical protein
MSKCKMSGQIFSRNVSRSGGPRTHRYVNVYVMFTYGLLKGIKYPIVFVWESTIGCVGMWVTCNVDIEAHCTSMSNVKM